MVRRRYEDDIAPNTRNPRGGTRAREERDSQHHRRRADPYHDRDRTYPSPDDRREDRLDLRGRGDRAERGAGAPRASNDDRPGREPEEHGYRRHREQKTDPLHVAHINISRTWLTAVVVAVTIALRWTNPHIGLGLADMLLRERDLQVLGAQSEQPHVEIFTAPKPFRGEDGKRQLRALETWLALRPKPSVTFLGDSPGVGEVAEAYGLRWVPNVDTTFLGVPLFSAVLNVARSSLAKIVVVANADILMFDDFTYALRKASRDLEKSWMLVGARWDIETLPPRALDPVGPGRRLSDARRAKLSSFARSSGVLHTYGGIDVWAWNSDASSPLLHGNIPHFIFGRGKYDNWFTHEVLESGHRAVVDISEACTLVHLAHDYHLMDEFSSTTAVSGASAGKRSFWSQNPRTKFELYINSYLAARHGTYTNQMGTLLHTPYKLTSCYEQEGFCLFKRRRPHNCRCEHSPFVEKAQTDPFAVNDSKIVFCGLRSSDSNSVEGIAEHAEHSSAYQFVVSGHADAVSSEVDKAATLNADTDYLHGALLEERGGSSALHASRGGNAFGLPLTLARLLEVVEHRTGSTQVVMTLVSATYKLFLPQFVCACRTAGVFNKLIVAALDDDTYRFAVTRGYAVYLDETLYDHGDQLRMVEEGMEDERNKMLHRALRARLTRRILGLGRTMFYIDTDIVLLKDPFKASNDRVDIGLLSTPKRAPGPRSSRLPRRVLQANKDSTPAVPRVLCTSVLYARPSPAANEVLEKLSLVRSWGSDVSVARVIRGLAWNVLHEDEFVSVAEQFPWPAVDEHTIAMHMTSEGTALQRLALLNMSPYTSDYDADLGICGQGTIRESKRWKVSG